MAQVGTRAARQREPPRVLVRPGEYGEASDRQLDKELKHSLVVEIDAVEARRALTELDLLDQRDTSLPPGLVALRESLKAATAEAQLPADEGV